MQKRFRNTKKHDEHGVPAPGVWPECAMLAMQQRWQNARGETDYITEDYLYNIREQGKNFKGEFFERDCSWTGLHFGMRRFFRHLDEG
jgi:hypothetical protein